MPYVIKNRLFAAILFNGQEFPFEINALDYIHISSSVKTYLPILTLKLTDITKFLTLNNFLVDGTLVTVTVGRDNLQKTSFNFRLFSFKEFPAADPKYVIHAYLDAPLYWTSSLSEFKKGSSSSVLGQLAQLTGLSYSGPTTSDAQVWIPQNRRISEFARFVCSHGWSNASSCMQIGVTASKELRYRNVSDFAQFPVKDFFDTTKITDQVKPMTSYSIANSAGFFNVNSGYGDRRITQGVSTEDEEISTLTLQKNSAKLMMNTAVRSSIQRNRVLYAPVDVGNVHANYERALYQNRRLSNLFVMGMEIQTPVFSEADLLDVVSLAIEVPDVKGSKQYSGKYLVTEKVVYVTGANYFEKLVLARHGLNESRESTQD
jgi:hypothetical protein